MARGDAETTKQRGRVAEKRRRGTQPRPAAGIAENERGSTAGTAKCEGGSVVSIMISFYHMKDILRRSLPFQKRY
ncbi:hypothetical protein GCK32_005612 [Trichostrongylus colubriformis]|uniref:Uncharacterized protein n=1 Tax=Trichostrongylus colubriformis TaxID=6319 RepID=A0AAN8FFD0_TRICO